MRANIKETKPKRIKRIPETRVSDDEFLEIKLNAKKSGLVFSEFHRRALLDIAVIVRDPVADAQLLAQLSAIGNNLNQLVRKEHIHNKSDTLKMRNILSAIDEIVIGVADGS